METLAPVGVGVVAVETPLERIAYLASSEHRLAILEVVGTGSVDARAIRSATGASRSTVSRTLRELERRDWIVRAEAGYETTPVGDLVLAKFCPLVETMERVSVLEAVADLLPVEEMSVSLEALGDARLVRPTENNLNAHLAYGLDLIRDADDLAVVADAILPRFLTTIRERVADGELNVTQVYGRDVLETIRTDTRLSDDLRALVDAGGQLWRYDDGIPYTLFLFDDRVVFLPHDGSGPPDVLLETNNEEVLAWANAAVDTFKAEATTVEPTLVA